MNLFEHRLLATFILGGPVVSHSMLNALNLLRQLREFFGFQPCAGNVQSSVGALVCIDVVADHKLHFEKAFCKLVVSEIEFRQNFVNLARSEEHTSELQ